MKKSTVYTFFGLTLLLPIFTTQAASKADELCGSKDDQVTCLAKEQAKLDKRMTKTLSEISHQPKFAGQHVKVLTASQAAWKTFAVNYCKAYSGAFGAIAEQNVQYSFCYFDKSYAHHNELKDLGNYYGED
ncbi:lysozyme inhibitor LprI family protein [Leeia sp. TBRC 13508]|uniref:Lysozyme inhibitor LprI family protein n=1 Tax=Leeia speluncae TaxID=2884804 RepID=A0ABS8D329_9NEIS|nr:lysozyme inhibitor LprI family protein [Leeia speluncae]MCB6182058.1 lysozyme inhibitor LprI family protein [Leeia speluncae]